MRTTRIIMVITLSLAGVAVAGRAQADGQSVTIRQVLEQVEANNKELQANSRQIAARKLEVKAENNLSDPTVSYSHQYGNLDGLGFQGELIASQSFQFPTVYMQRNKLSKTTGEGLDYQQAALRQQTLLAVEEVCLDLILLNQQQALLNERLANAERLAELYARRLASGDANVLETNKIDLELLNIRTEVRRNEAAIVQQESALASLNGGVPVSFRREVYEQQEDLPSLADLWNEKSAADPQLLALKSEQAVNRQQVRVSRSQWMPDLELGYRLNTASGGERYNGFLVGVSIPLFANRHQVQKAKAQVLSADIRYDDASIRMRNDLEQLYRQSVSLRTSLDEYQRLLRDKQALSLLNKALDAGQLSMIEYFVEVATLYDSMENRMRVENEYRKAVAGLLKHRL